MAYYALLAFGIIVLAASAALCIKFGIRLVKVRKAQDEVMKEHPEAKRVFTERGILMMDSFIIVIFLFMGFMEMTNSASSDHLIMPMIMGAVALAYLAQVLRTVVRGTLIIGRHFFMSQDQVCRYRSITKMEPYRNRVYVHVKDGSYIELTQTQADLVSQANKKSGTFNRT